MKKISRDEILRLLYFIAFLCLLAGIYISAINNRISSVVYFGFVLLYLSGSENRALKREELDLRKEELSLRLKGIDINIKGVKRDD